MTDPIISVAFQGTQRLQSLHRLQGVFASWCLWIPYVADDPTYRRLELTAQTHLAQWGTICPKEAVALWFGPHIDSLDTLISVILDRHPLPVLWRPDFMRKYFSDVRFSTPSAEFDEYDALLMSYQQGFMHQVDSVNTHRRTITRTESQHALQSALRVLANPLRPSLHVNANPVISIVIPAYNEQDRIGFAIRSVLAQLFTNFELICINDGSTDNTKKSIAAFSDPRIKLVDLVENRGKAAALNEALKHANGHFLLELDADDWLDVDALSHVAQHMQWLDKRIGIISGNYWLWRTARSGQLLCQRLVHNASITLTERQAHPPIPRIYRKEALTAVGGWPLDDMSSGRLYEDVAVCSMILKDFALSFVAKPIYNRVIRQDSISQRNNDQYPAWAADWFSRHKEIHYGRIRT